MPNTTSAAVDFDPTTLGTCRPPSELTRQRKHLSHALIPGGAHTYAKGDDQYPEDAPPFIERGKGSHVWDPDGNEYIEYGMGLRAVTLGHAHPLIVSAAHHQMLRGTNFTRPALLEVEAAERLSEVVQPGHMVKFAKNGSDVTTAAVRLARAHTGRPLIGVCSDQPFFSTDDWFITRTPMSAGIPESVGRLTVPFPYGDLAAVQELFDRHPAAIAGLILEATRDDNPPIGYLQALRDLCHREGALLILDEMITGFRWPALSAQQAYGVEPDLSTFGKGIANGFSVAALVGRPDVMELGGWDHDRDRVFLLSTTHGAETHALAALVATMDIYRTEPVIEVLHARGERLARGCNEAARAAGLSDHVDVVGRASNLVFRTRDSDGQPSQPFRTLFMQQLLRHGVLAPSFVVSYAHTEADIDHTVDVVTTALEVYGRALDEGVDRHLRGRPVQPAFRRRR